MHHPADPTEKQGTSQNQHLCKFCQKSFARKYAKDIHERIHTGEKLFSCDICKKSWTDPSNLTKHKHSQHSENAVKYPRKSRQENKSYKCEKCDKTFIGKSIF